MDDNDDINFQKLFNKRNKERKGNEENQYKKIQNLYKYRREIKDINHQENCFRKNYINKKIKNPNINRTLNDIYDTINSINKINKKIYKIFYKRKNTKSNINTSETIKENSIKNKIFNEYKNNSNKQKQKQKKTSSRSNYSYDNIISRNDYFSLINNKKEKAIKNKKKECPKKIDDRSIIYISSYISEELNKNKINNKLNYDYNDIHLKERLNKYKNKLKRSQTCDNIFDLNHFRNSKNIKDIIVLEKYKQNEFQKLENIKNLKRNYISNIDNEKKNSSTIKNISNHKLIKYRPFCFNDNIDKIKTNQKYNHVTIKNNNTNYFINKIFAINEQNENNKIRNQNNENKDYNKNLINQLNYNYDIYKNILHNY